METVPHTGQLPYDKGANVTQERIWDLDMQLCIMCE